MAEGSEARPTEPPEFNELTPVVIGTAVWAVLLVISLAIRPHLIDTGREWWIWSAVTGVVLGLFGCLLMRRRAQRRAGNAGSAAPGTTEKA